LNTSLLEAVALAAWVLRLVVQVLVLQDDSSKAQ
jgi:hypothetical protein